MGSTGQEFARHAFGAQFAEVQVDQDTAEVRVRRLLGVFAAGRVINPPAARSQLTGAMIMGLSMALLEHSTTDPSFGGHVERDLAAYHVAAHADVTAVDAHWIDDPAPTSTRWAPRGSANSASWGRRRRSATPCTTPPAPGSANCPSGPSP